MEDIRAIRFWLARATFLSWIAVFILYILKVVFLALAKITGAWITRWLNSSSSGDSGTNLFLALTVVLTFVVKKRQPKSDWFIAGISAAGITLLLYVVFLLIMTLLAAILEGIGFEAGRIAHFLVVVVIPAIGTMAGFFTFLWFACQVWLILEAKARGDDRGYLQLTIELEREAFAEFWGYAADKLLSRLQS